MEALEQQVPFENPSQEFFKGEEGNLKQVSLITAKNGDQFNLLCTEVSPVEVDGMPRLGYFARYFITDNKGVAFCNFWVENRMEDLVQISAENNNPFLQGQGLITSGLRQVVKDVFREGIFDGKPGKNGLLQIDLIELAIETDNIASQRTAIKNGFTYDASTKTASLTRSDYLASK